MACVYFDRFHDCIIKAFVPPMSGFPALAQDKTVDDVPAVAPESAKEALKKFVETYRTTLSKLNIKAAPDDPTCTKAFDGSREGEILGVRFDTVSITWSLPHDKLHTLVTGLPKLAAGTSNHNSRELQSVLGKLNNISQLCPALKTFTSEATFMMREHIHALMDEDKIITDSKRDEHIFTSSPEVSQLPLYVLSLYTQTPAAT